MKKSSTLNSISLLTLTILFVIGQLLYSENVLGASSVALKGKDFEVSFPDSKKVLWQYKETKSGKTLDFTSPLFEIDGKKLDGDLTIFEEIVKPLALPIGVTEYVVQGAFRQMLDIL